MGYFDQFEEYGGQISQPVETVEAPKPAVTEPVTKPVQPVKTNTVKPVQQKNNYFSQFEEYEAPKTAQVEQQTTKPQQPNYTLVNGNTIQSGIEKTAPKKGFLAGMGRLGSAVVDTGKNIWNNKGEIAKGLWNGMVVEPVHSVVTHPIKSAGAFARGVGLGVAALPQDIANIPIALTNTFAGEQKIKPVNYMNTIEANANAMYGNGLLGNNDETKSVETLGQFFGLGGALKGGIKGVKAVNNLNKTAKAAEEARTISALRRVQAVEDANQTAKVTQAAKPNKFVEGLKRNAVDGAVLGGLSEARSGDAQQMLEGAALGSVIGAGLHTGFTGLGKVGSKVAQTKPYKTVKGAIDNQIQRNNTASSVVAQIDSALGLDGEGKVADYQKLYKLANEQPSLKKYAPMIGRFKEMTNQGKKEVFENLERGEKEAAKKRRVDEIVENIKETRESDRLLKEQSEPVQQQEQSQIEPKQVPARTPVDLEQPQDLISLVNNLQGNKPKAIAEPLSPVKETPKVNIPKEDLNHVPAQSDMPVETIKAEPAKVVEEAPKSPQQIQKEKYQKFNDKRNGIYIKQETEPVPAKTEAQKFVDDYLQADETTKVKMVERKIDSFNGNKKQIRNFLKNIQEESNLEANYQKTGEEISTKLEDGDWKVVDKTDDTNSNGMNVYGTGVFEKLNATDRTDAFMDITKRSDDYLKSKGIDINKGVGDKAEYEALKQQNAETKQQRTKQFVKTVEENRKASVKNLKAEAQRIFKEQYTNHIKNKKTLKQIETQLYKQKWADKTAQKEANTAIKTEDAERINKEAQMAVEASLKRQNIDRNVNYLNSMDNGEVSKSIQDVTNTRFAKADRFFTSHKISDFADEIASENKEVAKCIKDYLGDEHTFDFDDLPASSNGRTVENGFTLNSSKPLEKQMATAKHETHHVLTKLIAKACGKESNEYKILQEGIDANNAMHNFEKANPEIVKINDTYNRLYKQDKQQAYDYYLDNYEIWDTVEDYRALKRKYWDSQIEIDARNASEGKWSFFGKDIKEYEQNLQRLRREGTAGIRRDTGKPATRTAEEIRKFERGKHSEIHGSDKDVSGTDRGHSSEGRLESKEYDYDNPSKFYDKPAGNVVTKARTLARISKAGEQAAIETGLVEPEQAANRLLQQHYKGEGFYHKRVGNGSGNTPKLTYKEKAQRFIERMNKDKGGIVGLSGLKNANPLKGEAGSYKTDINKVGGFGRKEKYGVKKSFDYDNSFIATIEDSMKKQHHAGVMKFVRDTFAEPIENGAVKDGYIPVNEQILSNAIYHRMSKDWYQDMRLGTEESISRASNNAEDAKVWTEKFKDSHNDTYQIPKEVFNELITGKAEDPATYWNKYVKGGKVSALKGGLKFAGAIQDAMISNWKRGVLSKASFYLNNRRGNQQQLLSGAETPLDYIMSFYDAGKWAIDEKKSGGKVQAVPEELVGNSITEVAKDWNTKRKFTGIPALDNYFNLTNGHLIDVDALKKTTTKITKEDGVLKYKKEHHNTKGSVLAAAGNICLGLPNKAFTKLSDALMKINEKAENFERRQGYSIQISKARREYVKNTGMQMMSQTEFCKYAKNHPELQDNLIRNVENSLGDYNNFTKAEQRYLKSIVPFYSWYRTVARWHVQMAKHDPAKLAMIYLLKNKLENDDEDLKDYQRGSLRLKTDQRSGKQTLTKALTKIDIVDTVDDIKKAATGEGGAARYPMLNNLAKTTLEAVAGKHDFRGSEITNKRYSMQYYRKGNEAYKAVWDSKKHDWVRDTEGNPSKTMPASVRAKYWAKENLVKTTYPMMNSIATQITNIKGNDKAYDADFGGYKNGDYIDTNWNRGEKHKRYQRYAANNLSPKNKALNTFVGLGIQNVNELSAKEKARLQKEKYKRFMQRQGK